MLGLLKRFREALVIGIGGAGDVLGTIPTRNALLTLGLRARIGSVLWERMVLDPKPGPRRLEEVAEAEKVSRSLALVGPTSRLLDGPVPQASVVAGALGEKVAVVDITAGPRETARGLREAMERLGVDLLIGIDVGGDVLARPQDREVRSPLTDALMLSALCLVPNSLLGIFGMACDGELPREVVEARLSEVAGKGGYLGALGMAPQDVALMERLSQGLVTEASRLPIEAAKGFRGTRLIRDGTRRAEVSIISSITFYLDPLKAYELCPLAQAVREARSLEEANEALHGLGLFTELDRELEAARRGSTSYRGLP
ncbi:MAG: hypothetical protein C4339_06255 [Nitrososphaerota archaeon]|mgnify:CR=1 FL=1